MRVYKAGFSLLLHMHLFNHLLGDDILKAPTIKYHLTYFPMNSANGVKDVS